MKITHIGQSTFQIVTAGGAVILTDPWFGGYPLLRVRPPARRPRDIRRVDLMLVSHNHIDHVDRHAFALARRTAAVVAGPPRVAARARRRGITTVSLGLRQEHDFGGVKIHTVPAEHPLCSEPLGFLIFADGKTVYFSGDTRNFPALRSALSRWTIDIALVQIACARYFGKPDGMDLESASRLLREVKPKLVVPMHFDGRFKTADPQTLVSKLNGGPTRVRILPLGEEQEL